MVDKKISETERQDLWDLQMIKNDLIQQNTTQTKI